MQSDRTTGRCRPVLLTVPLLPMERWLSCCVRGPIMEVGWMDMVCSRPGVSTVPCGRRSNIEGKPNASGGKTACKRWTLTVGGMMYDWWCNQEGLCTCRRTNDIQNFKMTLQWTDLKELNCLGMGIYLIEMRGEFFTIKVT